MHADVDILISDERIPWSGHSGRFAVGEVYEQIKAARMSLVFVNTRSQAELLFQELWNVNEDGLPIALHHGSLAKEQRRKVEAAMAAGQLKAVVCTSTLDLGIDFIDTARAYRTEVAVGKALRGRRDSVVISTKASPGPIACTVPAGR